MPRLSQIMADSSGNGRAELDRIPDAKKVKPKDKEQTEAQRGMGLIDWLPGMTFGALLSGFPPAPLGTLDTYRWMSNHHTLALGEGVVSVQVMGPAFPIESDKDTPDEWVNLIERTFLPNLVPLIQMMLQALSLRWQPFEVIWGIDKNGYHVPVRFKMLLQEKTFALHSRTTGQFVGLRNGDADLFGPNFFTFAERPFYDRPWSISRHEACRETAWWPWMETNDMGHRLDKKASGMVFLVKGPTGGDYKDGSGNRLTGAQASLNLANALQQGISAYCPNQILNAREIKQFEKLAKISMFEVQHFDLGDMGNAITSNLEKLRYYDSGMFRAWRRPERSALEGQRGTLAEAETHGDVGQGDSDILRRLVASALNSGPIDATLVENFGEKARGTVYLRPAPVSDARYQVLKLLIDRLSANPQYIGPVAANTDWDAVFDVLSIPKKNDIVNIDKPVAPLPTPGGEGKGNKDPKQKADPNA